MKKKILLILVLMLMGICAAAQSNKGRINGIVVDEAEDTPLTGATIIIRELQTGAIADINGKFSFADLPEAVYTVGVELIGYITQDKQVRVERGKTITVTIALKPQPLSLEQATVTAKSEARMVREQAMPVSVISMKQLQGTVSDIQGILAKTVGVTVRSTGGVGSASRLSVRGLEGKRIGFFLDEAPMNDQSDFLDLNDIPVDMIDRIEIYKGVVPAKFGGSSMGGAVNIVLKEYPDHYADLSYTRESFNVNKAQAVFKRNLRGSGLVLGVGGGYTYADNSYTMESPYVKGLKIKRDHDNFQKILIGGSLKAKKWWFDLVEFEPAFVQTYRQIQGIETDIRQAHTTSRAFLLSNKLEKDDFFLEGLDLDMSTAVAYTEYSLVDTAKFWYDWSGRAYPTPSPLGGELGNRFPSKSFNRKATLLNKLNLEYLINENHSISLNSVFSIADGYPSDELKEKSLGKKIDFDSHMRSWVAGLAYDFRTTDDRFLNSITTRYYWYRTNTSYQNIYVNMPPEEIALNKSSFGFSDALRYRFTPAFMIKLSGGYDVRIPAENELLGDGYSIIPSEKLMPEQNLSFNASLLYDVAGTHPSNLQVELGGYYMYLRDMIRYAKGLLGAQYQNFGEMRTLGAELEVKADVFPFLYLYGNVNYQDLRDVREFEEGSTLPNPTKGKRMPNIPYFMANAGLEFHWENLFGGQGQNTRLFADAAFVEEYYYDFEFTDYTKRRIPRSLTVDLGFEHSFMHQRLFISGKIKNLTDAAVLSEFNQPLPGRSFAIKLRYIFR
ncbi:MAG: TonB-dependent receptor [Bacteroidales bacterium]|nr:TonB-dependent receptor [Bacteroidales bacterium]